MLIEIHAIQNHSPANLNRDDLGAPKTCYFGGVLRSRISSQCIKRSIRMSEEFRELLGGVRTRRLAELIVNEFKGTDKERKRAEAILEKCGIKGKGKKKPEGDEDDDSSSQSQNSKMLVYTTRAAINEMASFLQKSNGSSDDELALEFGRLISQRTAVPDMALSGRMLETGVLKDTTVEAALQVAHAISTHEARPEVDYYVAADDIPGEDAGAGFVDEAMFASACYYKYFSINWEQLVSNLNGNERLAAHTVGTFIKGVAMSNPSGKQNSYAAHNPPEGILVEIKSAPVSYANAFAEPVSRSNGRGILEQSIAQLATYATDIEAGFGAPNARFWFSPNLRYLFTADGVDAEPGESDYRSLEGLIDATVNRVCAMQELGFTWKEAQETLLGESELAMVRS